MPLEGYEDISMDNLRQEWYRDIPAEWQRKIMAVEPRIRIIQHVASRHYLIIMRQSPSEPVSHIETFGTNPDGTPSLDTLYRWIPIRWHPNRAGIDYFVQHLEKARKLFEERFGNASRAEVERALRERDTRTAAQLKAEGDDKIHAAAREAMSSVATQRTMSIPGLNPGQANTTFRASDAEKKETKLILGLD